MSNLTTNCIKQLYILTLLIFAFTASGQKENCRLTVLFFDNQHPAYKVTVDTLIKAKKINLINTPVDIYYTCKNFHLPYYLPTEGLARNAKQDKECNMKIYPVTVKCYEYGKNNRVIKMTVHGSGTMNQFRYYYNNRNQIIEIVDNEDAKYWLSYNLNGTIAWLKKIGTGIEKKLVFVYE